MKIIKSISKRTLALVLSMLMLLSSGIVGTLAANVDMAETGAYTELAETGVDHTGGYVYFLKPSTWAESTVMMFIGHDTYTSVYTMTKVTNTDNLYRYSMPSWSGATYVAFANDSYAWGSGNWGPSNRTNAEHYTNVYNNYGFYSGSYYVCVPASTANNASLSINYKSSASTLNLTTRANVYAADAGSTTYSSNAAAGTVSVSGYYMSAYSTASARAAVSSTATTAYASTTLAPGSTATFTATANSGYDFVGWSTSSSEANIVSTDATYKFAYDISYTAKTVYALFKQATTKYTVTFEDWNGTVLKTQEVAEGGSATPPENPTRDGYKFIGWDPEYTNVTSNLTVKATYEEIVYHSITVNQTGGTGTVTSSVNSLTKIEAGTNVTVTIAAPDGYYISSLNGKSNSDQTKTTETVTFSSLSKDETIEVTYTAKTQYIVTASAGEGGKVTPTSTTAYSGDEVTFTATPADGYAVEKWTVDGVEMLTEGNDFKLTVSGNNKVSVTFTEDTSVRRIYLHTNYDWSNFNAYAWVKDTTDDNHAWPGVSMKSMGIDEDGNKLYYIEIDSKYDMIIFNNGSNKTNDIPINTNGYTLHYNLVGGENGWFIPGLETLKIYLDNGADKHYQIDGTGYNYDIAHLSFDTSEEGVIDLDSVFTRTHRYDSEGKMNLYDTGYRHGYVASNMPVTIRATITSDAPEYEVDGFLINGEKFIKANNMGNGVYEAVYTFTENGTVVVPIYSYTDAFIKEHELTEITLYAQKPEDFTGNWGDYMAAYVWYDKPGDTKTTDYIFGAWPGQVMIPVEGVENYWYTTVTSSSANGYPASGITFSNYGGWSTSDGVMHPVTEGKNVQVYDYYEFITLAEQKASNITFVLKNGESDNGSGDGLTIKDDNFTNYVNVSGETIDVYGNKISDAADIGLYVIRNAPVDSHADPLSGNYYVECSLYSASGDYIGKCFSYELLDIDVLAEKLKSTALTDLSGKRVRVDYEVMTHIKNKDDNDADRYDGQWYNAVEENEIAVNVALTEDHGANYTVNTVTPVNDADYGYALVSGGQVATVVRGEEVTLSATARAGYKFIGWYYNGASTPFATSTTTTIKAVVDATYTAVFQKLAEAEFIVTHEIYKGGGSADYIPAAHGGRANLYIGIVNETRDETFEFTQTGQASVEAYENDVLTITIGTDAMGADRFYAWYIDAVDKYGLTTYEEVGVDNYSGGEYGNLYDNRIDTVIGSSDLVYFQFKYTVKEDMFNIALYSDLVPVSVDVNLVYNYENRYGEIRSVTKKYTLSDDEITGCEGNNGKPYTPTQETIYKYAPYIEDFYKDSTWEIEGMYDDVTFELWATQPETIYTVTVNVGGSTQYFAGAFNTELQLNARELDNTVTNMGFWYNDNEDLGERGSYDEDYDTILSYGTYYGLRITENMTLCYESDVDKLNFMIRIEDPVYGREQSTDSSGGNATDFIYIDYMTSILVPFFKGDIVNDKKITEVIYKDESITTTNTSVTLETLEKLGYEFDYGIILEQLNTNDYEIDEVWGINPTNEEDLTKILTGDLKGKTYANNSKYAIVNSAVGVFELTNKNRLLFTFQMANNPSNQNKYFNVYGYLAVTDPSDVTTYYFSNMQTLNIMDIGTSEGTDQIGGRNY